MLLPVLETEADCKARQRLADRLSAGLSALEVSVIPVLPRAAQQGRNTCGADAKVYFRGDPSQRSIRLEGLGGLFLDGDRTVRRVFPYDAGASGAELIIEDVGLWFDGKEWFKSQCARCHGDDGKDEGYPGAKSLAGIGNRHSEKEIIELTELSGFVDLHSMNARARRALGIFVAGL